MHVSLPSCYNSVFSSITTFCENIYFIKKQQKKKTQNNNYTSSKLKGPLLSLSALPKYHSFSPSLFMSGDASSTLLWENKDFCFHAARCININVPNNRSSVPLWTNDMRKWERLKSNINMKKKKDLFFLSKISKLKRIKQLFHKETPLTSMLYFIEYRRLKKGE